MNAGKMNLEPGNWAEARMVAHRIIDETFEVLENIDTNVPWKAVPDDVISFFQSGVPRGAAKLNDVYESYKTNVLPYYQGNIHPSYFAWIQGGGNVTACLADFLSSVFNSNAAIGNHAARYLEDQVLNWCKEIFDLPESSGGSLLTGSSMANLTAIAVAKNRAKRLLLKSEKLMMYCSAETHNCIAKSVGNLGLRLDQLKIISSTSAWQIDIELLDAEIKLDMDKGNAPFMIIGNIGAVNTGAIDPVDRLLEVSRNNGVWLHLDGAYGLPAYLTSMYRQTLEGINCADSIAFDFHKLFNINYDVGCIMVKNKQHLEDTFSTTRIAHYLINGNEGIAGGPPTTDNLGFELSRSFRALKIWMTFKEHGIDKIAQVIESKFKQAQFLERLILQTRQLKLIVPAQLSIINFIYWVDGLDAEALDNLNRNIVIQIQKEGIAVPSLSVINGQIVIRVCIANHRTETYHLQNLINAIIKTGDMLSKNE